MAAVATVSGRDDGKRLPGLDHRGHGCAVARGRAQPAHTPNAVGPRHSGATGGHVREDLLHGRAQDVAREVILRLAIHGDTRRRSLIGEREPLHRPQGASWLGPQRSFSRSSVAFLNVSSSRELLNAGTRPCFGESGPACWHANSCTTASSADRRSWTTSPAITATSVGIGAVTRNR